MRTGQRLAKWCLLLISPPTERLQTRGKPQAAALDNFFLADRDALLDAGAVWGDPVGSIHRKQSSFYGNLQRSGSGMNISAASLRAIEARLFGGFLDRAMRIGVRILIVAVGSSPARKRIR
jgi:hypothetical protein